jgi:TolB protein
VNTIYRPAKRLTFLERQSVFPQFSPSGEQIVFSASGRGRSAVYRMNLDGSDLQCLTTGEEGYESPVFSPDGAQIAYVAYRLVPGEEPVQNIYVMNADGTDQRALTATDRDRCAVFSPNGQHIAFVSGRDGVMEIYRMRADGTEQRRLTFVENRPEQQACPSPRNSAPVFRQHATIAA